MGIYDAKGIRKQLLEVIWEGIYLDKTLNVNQVVEDLVSYLSMEEAKQILRIYKMGGPTITN